MEFELTELGYLLNFENKRAKHQLKEKDFENIKIKH